MRRAAIQSRRVHLEIERRRVRHPAGDWRIQPFAALACGLAGVWACGLAPESGSKGDSGSGGPGPPTVEVTVIEPRPLIDTVALTGQLEAENSVLMKPEVDGVVASIEFVEGQPIAKGEVLITLRDDVQRATVKEAQAEMRLAEQVYGREAKLARRDASSVARIEEARAKLDTAQARLRLAEIELERTRIRAPFDGTPGARLVAPGARVEDHDALVPFDSIDRLQLLFTVPENAVRLAKLGGRIHVRVAAWPQERFAGEVFFVSPTIDPAARRLLLKAWVLNSDHRLKPGMFANVDVQIAERAAALMVPEAAIVYDRNGTYLWRMLDEDHAEKVPVKIGLRSGGEVEIVAGLSPGDAVVSAGTHKVMAGKRILTVESPGTAHAAEEPTSTPDSVPDPVRGKES